MRQPTNHHEKPSTISLQTVLILDEPIQMIPYSIVKTSSYPTEYRLTGGQSIDYQRHFADEKTDGQKNHLAAKKYECEYMLRGLKMREAR